MFLLMMFVPFAAAATTEASSASSEHQHHSPRSSRRRNLEDQAVSSPADLTTTTSLNMTELTASVCQKMTLAVSLLSSLEFQDHFSALVSATTTSTTHSNSQEEEEEGTTQKTTTMLHDSEQELFFHQVFLLQLFLLPLSLGFLLFGSSLLLHACILCAALTGLFVTFDVLEAIGHAHAHASFLDCNMKLALSLLVAFVCAVLAISCFRFGLFCFGGMAFGGMAYAVLDAFPELDPGTVHYVLVEGDASNNVANVMPASDLSAMAWGIICIVAVMGGALLRYLEQVVLELLTAFLGGVGFAYSLHAILWVRVHYLLDPSIVVVIAFFTGLLGWRVQRRRRLATLAHQYTKVKTDDDEITTTTNRSRSTQAAAMVDNTIAGNNLNPWLTAPQQQQQLELQQSLQAFLPFVATASAGTATTTLPSADQVRELTKSLNGMLDRMESGGGGANHSNKDK